MLELGRLARAPTPTRPEVHGRPLAPKGEAGVMIEWSWRVERARSIEVGSWSSDRQIDAGIARLAGPEIVHLRVVGRIPELEISFSDGRWLHSFMTAEGQPSWTVFLQDGSWLSVARGRVLHDTQNQRRRRRSGAPAA
jgi:hypothetical protein